jgi:hypothetical protein
MQTTTHTTPTPQTAATLVAAALTEAQLAARWGVSPKTLQDWRRTGAGPAFLKLAGKAIRYPLAAVEKYEAEHLRQSTATA